VTPLLEISESGWTFPLPAPKKRVTQLGKGAAVDLAIVLVNAGCRVSKNEDATSQSDAEKFEFTNLKSSVPEGGNPYPRHHLRRRSP